jgi:hypothetical protein
LGCSFLFKLPLHDLRSFHHRLSPIQVLLHESQALILMAEACQFIFDDCFILFFRVLLLVHLDLDGLVLVWGWGLSVWVEVFRSSGFCGCWTGLCGWLWVGYLGYVCGEDLTSDHFG